MTARKVVTPSGRRIKGYFPSRKAGRMVAWESKLERDACLLFEFSRAVAIYREQPERITYYIGGEPFAYYPDFELVLTSGELLHVEVKPKAKLRKLREKLSAIELHYSRIGRNFRVMTEDDIRVEPLLSNLKVLAYHNRQLDITDAQLRSWQGLVEEGKATTVEDAQRILGDVKKVYRLLAAGYLVSDLHVLLGPTSNIRVTAEDANDQIFF